MTENNILLKNGIIIDGKGSKPFRADLYIEDNKIADIGKIDHDNYDKIIDVKGDYITPGFIDIHSHSDLLNLIDKGLEPKIRQGVTTEVVGQCGLGVAPIVEGKKRPWREELIIGNILDNWPWHTMEEYLNTLQNNGLESNIVPFVGHGLLRYNVKGFSEEPLTKSELEQMRHYAENALKEGAKGLSMGLIYLPALFYNLPELEILFQTAADYNGMISVHLYSETDHLLEALQEVINLHQRTGCQLHISHLKAIGKENWYQIDEALKIMDKYDLTYDFYPYLWGNTTLVSILPPAAIDFDGLDNIISSLQKDEIREKVKQVFATNRRDSNYPWDNVPYFAGWDNIIISQLSSDKNKELIGLSLTQIAEKWDCEPAEAAMDLIIREKGLVKMIDRLMDEKTLLKIMKNSRGVVGTDTLLNPNGIPHPRVYGTYPRIFNKYVFNKKQFKIEEIVTKMTGKPAQILGLTDRGTLEVGKVADICVFNDRFQDRATYQDPERFPEGIKTVIINGEVKFTGGDYSIIRSGEII